VLTDGARKDSSLRINFANVPGRTTRVLLDLDITAQKRGDLDVYVRSPAGRVYVVASADPATTGSNLVLDDHDISAAFSRTSPNGRWQVFVRDSELNGARAQVNGAGLQLTSL
jgi:subtilisin-like proprotein convertase family protein